MENLKVIAVCFGLSVVMDDLNQNDDVRIMVLINRRWDLKKKTFLLTDKNIAANCAVLCINHHHHVC